MKDAVISMLRLQDTMNSRVDANWRIHGNAWYRAIWLECGELLDHYGWKWWKAQKADMPQVELELIDIWHFGLSIFLERIPQDDAEALALLADDIVNAWSPRTGQASDQSAADGNNEDFRLAVESFAMTVMQRREFDVSGFAELLELAGVSFDTLHRHYIGKNVLNIFRQDNGYKEGTYTKTWNGLEDNEHLMTLLNDEKGVLSADTLYASLKNRYALLTG